ncbi:RNA polymerase subunit sigma-24 [Chitinophaga caeni]|uniref:RNA polymerase subunit sigma-24 n=1 Tax=Chitinophaga caeni TaxID=2029983 RepID=A0A291QZX3_9BACT|nr:sigma-70 family RNA polymerase sigma factor [Chitinophaga caeni]ATL49442.1 RNA polymerase subunit sigma-24 [Chitinophaga caeni]
MENYQNILFPYAYNILGSVEDAKDAIQDIISNYYAKDHGQIENEKAYLIRSVINRAIQLKQQRKTISLEESLLPAPVVTNPGDQNLYLNQVLSYSMLILLEKLSPKERAVFILKESFDYSHAEIAETLDISEENSRKLFSRAKTNLFKPGEHAQHIDSQTMDILHDYVNAIRSGNLEALTKLLHKDITYYADGGKLRVVSKFTHGIPEVMDVIKLVYQRFQTKAKILFTYLNHQPALVYIDKNRVINSQVFEISPETGKIMQILIVVDPEKLKALEYLLEE